MLPERQRSCGTKPAMPPLPPPPAVPACRRRPLAFRASACISPRLPLAHGACPCPSLRNRICPQMQRWGARQVAPALRLGPLRPPAGAMAGAAPRTRRWRGRLQPARRVGERCRAVHCSGSHSAAARIVLRPLRHAPSVPCGAQRAERDREAEPPVDLGPAEPGCPQAQHLGLLCRGPAAHAASPRQQHDAPQDDAPSMPVSNSAFPARPPQPSWRIRRRMSASRAFQPDRQEAIAPQRA